MIDRELTQKLSDLGARITAGIDDMRERGAFTSVQAKTFADLAARRADLEDRMEKAVAAGKAGSAALVEVRRDVDALVDSFEQMLLSLGASALRH